MKHVSQIQSSTFGTAARTAGNTLAQGPIQAVCACARQYTGVGGMHHTIPLRSPLNRTLVQLDHKRAGWLGCREGLTTELTIGAIIQEVVFLQEAMNR